MSIWAGLLVLLLTVVFMEGFAYVAHRWLMHGPGWFLHKSHHEPRHGTFELNDLYAAIFAIPASALVMVPFMLGLEAESRPMGRSISAFMTSSCTVASTSATFPKAPI